MAVTFFIWPSHSEEAFDQDKYFAELKAFQLYQEHPTVKGFQKLNEQFRFTEYVNLLSTSDSKYNANGIWFKHKEEVLKRFLSTMPAEEQQNIYENAFRSALWEDVDPKKVEELFAKGTLGNPELVHQSLCTALLSFHPSVSRSEEEFISIRKRVVKTIIPFIKKNPNSFETQCEIENGNGAAVFNMTDIIYTDFPQEAFDLKNLKRAKAVTQKVAPLDFTSACSEHEIRCYFKDALSAIKEHLGPLQYIMIIRSGSCQINGAINKSKLSTFEFLQNYGQATAKSNKRTMLFSNLDEITTLFKATQKSLSDGEKPKPLPKYADGQLDCREVFGGKKSISDKTTSLPIQAQPAPFDSKKAEDLGGAGFSPFGRP